jgi:two-component system, OmpR family, sensor histidine kinase KdpD
MGVGGVPMQDAPAPSPMTKTNSERPNPTPKGPGVDSSSIGPTRLKVRRAGADDSLVDTTPLTEPAWRVPLRSIASFLEDRSPGFFYAAAAAVIAAIAYAKVMGEPGAATTSFLFIPIGLVIWYVGRRAGVATLVASSAAALAADLISAGPVSVTIWNGVGRTLMFVAFTLPLVQLKATIARQRIRLTEDELVASRLRELNDMKDALLHAVSHDLKQPVAGILGAAQTLRRESTLNLSDEERRDLLVMIEASGHRMNRLINDLLDLDRIDRGEFEPMREPTDVGELARVIAGESSNLVTHPVDVEADPVLVNIDRGKVERIIDNLLANAGRHTPRGTPVHIHVDALKNGVVLTVEDEGAGVPDELKERLFELFRQGGNPASGGLGVGLSLVRRFAEFHGGRAFVEDRPGGGARFVVMLPGEVTRLEEPAPSTRTAEAV